MPLLACQRRAWAPKQTNRGIDNRGVDNDLYRSPMTVSIEEITAAALALPAEARAELADRVAASIASGIPPHIRQLQMEEVQKRRAEVLSGKVQGVSSQQVRDEIASLLK